MPVAQHYKRIPMHLRKAFGVEINCSEKSDIIQKVTEPTPRVTCTWNDYRSWHVTPTLDDIIHKINDFKQFTKLDLNESYHNLKLYQDSRAIQILAHTLV